MKTMEKQLGRLAASALRRLMRRRPWLGLLLIAAAAAFLYFKPDWTGLGFPPDEPESAGVLTGRVIRVSDGDTLTLKTADDEIKVRLYGLDAPEMMQARGRESKKFLSRLVRGQEVRVETAGRDQYGRALGRIFVGGRAVDQSLVAAGQAWVYESYCRAPHCRELRRLQGEAQAGRLGLWRDKDPRPPWLWRKENPRH